MRFRPRFSLRALLKLVATIGVAAAIVTRSLYWVHERDALFSLMWSQKEWGFSYAYVGQNGPPKPIPLLWRLFGAHPVSKIILEKRIDDDLLQRFVAAYPEADVSRGDLPNLLIYGGGEEVHEFENSQE